MAAAGFYEKSGFIYCGVKKQADLGELTAGLLYVKIFSGGYMITVKIIDHKHKNDINIKNESVVNRENDLFT